MRRKKGHSGIYISLILLLIVLVALLVYEHFFPLDKAPVGIWSYSYDLSEGALPVMKDWIGEGVEAKAARPDIDETPVFVKVTLRIANDGTYEQSVDKASYDEARSILYERFNASLHELIRDHLTGLGMADDDLNDDEIEKILSDTVSMSGTEYLMKAVPDLIPSYDELVASYGNRGNYSVADGFIIFDGKDQRQLLFDKDTLLLDDRIYVHEVE